MHFEALEYRRVLASADIVFLIDESFSNTIEQDPTHAWIRNSLVPRLEAGTFAESLINKGITDIKYGLIGFSGPGPNVGQQDSDHAYSFVIDSSASTPALKLLGTSTQLVMAMGNLRKTGNIEDGWDAIEHAIAEFPFRAGAVPVIVLVQSEQGRTYGDLQNVSLVNEPLTREGIVAALASKNGGLSGIGRASHQARSAYEC